MGWVAGIGPFAFRCSTGMGWSLKFDPGRRRKQRDCRPQIGVKEKGLVGRTGMKAAYAGGADQATGRERSDDPGSWATQRYEWHD